MASPEQKQQVKQILIDVLRLRMKPEDIDDTAPLVGDGLGLDSVDVIEVSSNLVQRFGVEINDDEQGRATLQSVETLTDFLVAQGSLS